MASSSDELFEQPIELRNTLGVEIFPQGPASDAAMGKLAPYLDARLTEAVTALGGGRDE